MQNVKTPGLDINSFKYPVKAINILKNHGKSVFESQLINGHAIMTMRGSQGLLLLIERNAINNSKSKNSLPRYEFK